MKKYFPYLVILLFFSCKTQQKSVSTLSSKTIYFKVKSLNAINIEEASSLADELMLTYSLMVVNDTNRIISTVNKSWGIKKAQKNSLFMEKEFEEISIKVPENCHLKSSIALMEVDNYEKAQKTIDKINKFGSLAVVPATILQIAGSESPIGLILLGLKASNVGIGLISEYDKDDILGESSYNFDFQKINKSNFKEERILNYKGGKHIYNSYEYQLQLEIH